MLNYQRVINFNQPPRSTIPPPLQSYRAWEGRLYLQSTRILKRRRNIAHPVFMDMVGTYGWYIPQEHLEQIWYLDVLVQMSTTRKVECDINSSDYIIHMMPSSPSIPIQTGLWDMAPYYFVCCGIYDVKPTHRSLQNKTPNYSEAKTMSYTYNYIYTVFVLSYIYNIVCQNPILANHHCHHWGFHTSIFMVVQEERHKEVAVRK